MATQPWQDYAGLAESMELLADAGPARVRAHVLGLLDPLVEFLRARGVEIASDLSPERRSGILAFRTPEVEAPYRALVAAGVGCALREGAVRLAPHLYNQPEDVQRVMDVLDGAIPA